jgi:hypothetical protein
MDGELMSTKRPRCAVRRLTGLDSVIDDIAPHARPAGRRQTIFAVRAKKLEMSRENRK